MSAAKTLPSFFINNALFHRDVETCYAFAAEHFPNQPVQEAAQQGGCAFTLVTHSVRGETFDWATGQDNEADERTIIQFRLLKHAIPVEMAVTASRIYSPLAPKTRELGRVTVGNGVSLQVCAMSCIPGERFSELQPKTPTLSASDLERYRGLMRSLSTFFAKAWYAGSKYTPALTACTGKVGRSLLFRLGSLERHLPSRALRQKAQQTREAVEAGGLDFLPVILTHGDLLPSNMLVDEASWIITGYVDWVSMTMIMWLGLDHVLILVPLSCRPKQSILALASASTGLSTC